METSAIRPGAKIAHHPGGRPKQNGSRSRRHSSKVPAIDSAIPYWKFPHILIYGCILDDEDWADLLGLPLEDAAAWLEGDKERASSSNDRLKTLAEIITALGHVRDGQGIGHWMHEPQTLLDGARPLDYISVGHRPEPVVLAARQTAAREWGLSESSPYFPR